MLALVTGSRPVAHTQADGSHGSPRTNTADDSGKNQPFPVALGRPFRSGTSAALPPPAARLGNLVGSYLLFLNGFTQYSTASGTLSREIFDISPAFPFKRRRFLSSGGVSLPGWSGAALVCTVWAPCGFVRRGVSFALSRVHGRLANFGQVWYNQASRNWILVRPGRQDTFWNRKTGSL